MSSCDDDGVASMTLAVPVVSELLGRGTLNVLARTRALSAASMMRCRLENIMLTKLTIMLCFYARIML